MEKTDQKPMPAAGGSYIRDADGNLLPNPADEAVVAAAEAEAAALAETPAALPAPDPVVETVLTPDEPRAPAPSRRAPNRVEE